MLRESQTRLPMRVNDPLMVLFITKDESVVLLLLLGIGIVYDFLGYTFMVAMIYLWISSSVRKKFPRGYLNHFVWWYGLYPTMSKNEKMIDPIKREYIR